MNRRYYVRLTEGIIVMVDNEKEATDIVRLGRAISWWMTGPEPALPYNASRFMDVSLEGDQFVEIYLAHGHGKPDLGTRIRVYGNGHVEHRI